MVDHIPTYSGGTNYDREHYCSYTKTQPHLRPSMTTEKATAEEYSMGTPSSAKQGSRKKRTSKQANTNVRKHEEGRNTDPYF